MGGPQWRLLFFFPQGQAEWRSVNLAEERCVVIRSLKLGVALSCGIPLFLVFSLFIFLVWKNDDRERTGLLLEKASVLAERLSSRFDFSESLALSEADQSAGNDYLTDLVQDSADFSYIGVLDAFGRVARSSEDPQARSILGQEEKARVYEIRQAQFFPAMNEVYVPVFESGGKLAGLIRIGVQERGIWGIPVDFILQSVLLGALALAAAVGLSALLVRRFVGRSLAPLINSVERVAEGDFTRRVDTAYVRSELIPFSSSLNRLFESIESDKKRIHQFRSGITEYEKILISTKNDSIDQIQTLQREAAQFTQRFQTLLQLTWQGVVVFDETGKVIAYSPEIRRLIRFDRQEKDYFLPETIRRIIDRLFVSDSTERVDGNLELTDQVFLRSTHCRFRAQRMPSSGGRQQVLLVLEDSTRLDQVERERADLGELLRHTFLPVLEAMRDRVAELAPPKADEAESEEEAHPWNAIYSRAAYLGTIMQDWCFWDAKFRRSEFGQPERLNLSELLRELEDEKLGGFSEELNFHLPPEPIWAQGSGDEYRKMIKETYTLLQLAVPGEQATAVDVLHEGDARLVFFRKRASVESGWNPPSWLDRLGGKSVVSQDTWINLKISMVRLLAGLYGIGITTEVMSGKQPGLAVGLLIPVKQPKKTQDTAVDDLIKQFFVSPV